MKYSENCNIPIPLENSQMNGFKTITREEYNKLKGLADENKNDFKGFLFSKISAITSIFEKPKP